MKSSLVLLVFCAVLALVSNTEAGKGKGKERRAKMMKGRCKGMIMNFKGDPAWKACSTSTKAKEGVDGDEDDDVDHDHADDDDRDDDGDDGGDGGGGEGGKKGKAKGKKGKGKKGRGKWKKMCFMKAKKIIDGTKFQVEAAKNEITTKLSDQPEIAAAITKLLDECATENKLSELDFSDGNKESWKALKVCKRKIMKFCMEDKKEE